MKLINADALLKEFPIRLSHGYDRKHGDPAFVLGIETVLDYVARMKPYKPETGDWIDEKNMTSGHHVITC